MSKRTQKIRASIRNGTYERTESEKIDACLDALQRDLDAIPQGTPQVGYIIEPAISVPDEISCETDA